MKSPFLKLFHKNQMEGLSMKRKILALIIGVMVTLFSMGSLVLAYEPPILPAVVCVDDDDYVRVLDPPDAFPDR